MESLESVEKRMLSSPGEKNGIFRIDHPGTRLETVVLKPSLLAGLKEFLDHSDRVQECRRQLRLDDTIDYGRSTLILLHGPAGTGKTMTARAMANHTSRPLVTFPSGNSRTGGYSFDERLDMFFTLLETHHAIGLMDECQGYLGEDDYELPVFLSEVEKREITLFLATTAPKALGPGLDRRIAYKLATTQPDSGRRFQIWKNLLPVSAVIAADVDLRLLADQFNLNGGYIKNAILHALTLAIHRNPACIELRMADLVKACRIQEKTTGPGMCVRTVLDSLPTLDSCCINTDDGIQARKTAARLSGSIVDTANILVACEDIDQAETVALCMAGSAGKSVSRIDARLLLEGGLSHTGYDIPALLRQSLGAAYESGHIVMLCGLQDYLAGSKSQLCRFDERLVAMMLDHPGRKLIVLKNPRLLAHLFPHCFLDSLIINPPDHSTRVRRWQQLLHDYKVCQCSSGNLTEKLATFRLPDNAMKLAVCRAIWIASSTGNRAVKPDILLQCAAYAAELTDPAQPLFG